MATAVDQKLLRQTKFPPEFNQKVDKNKINVEVLKKWIARRLAEILGSEDDVVTELCFNLLETPRYLDIKALQIQLTGFLDRDASTFCKELWALCLSAQESPQGVPKELLEAKKQEIIQEKALAERAAQVALQQRETVAARNRDLDSIRARERGERSDRGRGFGGRGGRGGRDFDSRRPARSRSPPPRRRTSPYRGAEKRDIDTYIPNGSGRAQRPAPRRGRSRTRSISNSSPSRSPPRRERKRNPSSSRSRSPPRKQRAAGLSSKKAGPEMREEEHKTSHAKRSARSPTSSFESRSPSPRQYRDRRRRRYSSSRSPSFSPDRRRQRRRSLSASSGDSRDRRREESRRNMRPSTSSTHDPKSNRRTDIVRPRPRRADPRLSRSPVSPVRRKRSGSNASSKSPSRSRSRSLSRDRQRAHKRRRSLRRYDPRRRRNTSSPPPSSPEREREPKRRRRDASRSSHSSMSDITGDARGREHRQENGSRERA